MPEFKIGDRARVVLPAGQNMGHFGDYFDGDICRISYCPTNGGSCRVDIEPNPDVDRDYWRRDYAVRLDELAPLVTHPTDALFT